jgi:hypothetical protein
VSEFQNRSFDYRADGRYLRDAKRLLNPDPDPETGEIPQKFSMKDVKECFIALRDGTHPGLKGKKLASINFYTLFWGDPPYLMQWVEIPTMPPVYDTLAHKKWIQKYGKSNELEYVKDD